MPTKNDYNVDLIPGGLNRSTINTLINKNYGVFRNGINTNPLSQFEDPSYLGFTVEIDPESALFTDAKEFIHKMAKKGHNDIVVREQIYNNFVKYIKMVFNSQETGGSPEEKSTYVKQHYINKIGNLGALTKKYVTFKEDKITIELYEDVALFSTYLATTYNNLIFSYESGRILIPENLMYFNLFIKFSDVRSLTSTKAKYLGDNLTDDEIAAILNNKSTCMVYKLTDCLFNFFESVPFDDEVSQSGIDAASVPENTVNFDIYFKRINLILNAPLVDNALTFNNSLQGLGLKKPQEKTPALKETKNKDILKNDPEPQKPQKQPGQSEMEYKSSQIYQNYLKTYTEWQNRNKEYKQNLDTSMDKFDFFEDSKFIETDDIQEQMREELIKKNKTIENKTVEYTKNNVVVTNEDGTKHEMSVNDYLKSININKEPTMGQQSLLSKKNWLERTQDSWEDIRRGNNIISDFYKNKTSTANKYIKDNLGNKLGSKVNSYMNGVTGGIIEALNKYEDQLLEKKNKFINDFIYDIKKNTRILLDYNVYTDDKYPGTSPLEDFKNNVGNTVANEILNDIKGGTDTNIF